MPYGKSRSIQYWKQCMLFMEVYTIYFIKGQNRNEPCSGTNILCKISHLHLVILIGWTYNSHFFQIFLLQNISCSIWRHQIYHRFFRFALSSYLNTWPLQYKYLGHNIWYHSKYNMHRKCIIYGRDHITVNILLFHWRLEAWTEIL